ncbi:MAG: toxin-activating lysine-acyltransferase [Geminicoccaceae bacterium]
MLTHPTLYCRQFEDPIHAFGQAVDLLRRTQPFASYTFGKLTNVLMGEIKRRHYVFTFDDRGPVGYAGWALCDEAIARAWIEERYVPNFAECSSGDSLVGITFYAAKAEVCFFQARWCREQYPGLKVFGIRDYGRRSRQSEVTNLTTPAPARNRSIAGPGIPAK